MPTSSSARLCVAYASAVVAWPVTATAEVHETDMQGKKRMYGKLNCEPRRFWSQFHFDIDTEQASTH